MLRWCCLVSSLGVSFTLSTIISPTFSAPLSPNHKYPKVENSQADKPLCYIQMADSTTLDLQKLCSKNSPAKSNLGSRITKSQFRRGTGNAYVTDSQ